jgi:hypothetical protein
MKTLVLTVVFYMTEEERLTNPYDVLERAAVGEDRAFVNHMKKEFPGALFVAEETDSCWSGDGVTGINKFTRTYDVRVYDLRSDIEPGQVPA